MALNKNTHILGPQEQAVDRRIEDERFKTAEQATVHMRLSAGVNDTHSRMENLHLPLGAEKSVDVLRAPEKSIEKREVRYSSEVQPEAHPPEHPPATAHPPESNTGPRDPNKAKNAFRYGTVLASTVVGPAAMAYGMPALWSGIKAGANWAGVSGASTPLTYVTGFGWINPLLSATSWAASKVPWFGPYLSQAVPQSIPLITTSAPYAGIAAGAFSAGLSIVGLTALGWAANRMARAEGKTGEWTRKILGIGPQQKTKGLMGNFMEGNRTVGRLITAPFRGAWHLGKKTVSTLWKHKVGIAAGALVGGAAAAYTVPGALAGGAAGGVVSAAAKSEPSGGGAPAPAHH